MIEVKNLTFSYSKDKQALHGLDFTVEDGEIFGFLGPNGSGKSTTQKILTGILKGHGGKVSLFGQDISAVHGPEFFQKIGVLFEFPYLYANLSAVDNLEYFASFYPKEQQRDVGELLDTLEFKLDFLKKPVSSYSKGMRQRVSMARALVSNPRLLFLDEPNQRGGGLRGDKRLLSLSGPGRAGTKKQAPERPDPCGGPQRGAGIGGCVAPLPEKADGEHHVPERAQGKKYLAGWESEVWPLWVRPNERGEPVRRSIPAMLQAGGQQELSWLWDAPHQGI